MIAFIRKFIVYCKSDGLLNALKFSLKACVSFFYRNSTTLFFRRIYVPIAQSSFPDEMKNYVSVNELRQIDMPRLYLLDCKSKFAEGQQLYVTFDHGTPVAFSWTAIHHYYVHGVGDFLLNDNEYWIGPTFVMKSHRGRGLNKMQIMAQMNDYAGTFYTSVNSFNVPSIKSFLSLGFKEIGHVTYKKFLCFSSFSIVGDLLKNKIRVNN